MRRLLLTGVMLSFFYGSAQADSTGSVGCGQLAQAAADGASARMQANDQSVTPPVSISKMSCLDSFFNGTGLNVISSILDPTTILNSVKGQICSEVNTLWQDTLGSAQCGLTVSGFNLGFGLSGFGLMCPKFSFGGGGPPIGGVSSEYQTGNGTGLYINGSPTVPTGYTAPASGGIY